MSEVNLSEISASVINHQIDSAKSWLDGRLKAFWVKHIAQFKAYQKEAHKRHGFTKTLLYKEKAVPLVNLYVGTTLRYDKKPVKDYLLVKELNDGAKVLVTATAGSGKSFFAKFLFQALIIEGKRIPVFLEFRNLQDPDKCLIDNLVLELNAFDIPIDRDLLVEMANSGKFVFILDGYDEIAARHMEKIGKSLRELASYSDQCSIVVTSRPDDQIEYLQEFDNYHVLPLDLEKAASLVTKLDYDEKVKSKFLENLNKGLFKKHQDFLSNPLLLTILLMTYGEIAEIPSKIHIFYEHAFDTLFYKHDASKGMYRREVKSRLPIDDFKGVLAAMSASGYIRGKTSLSNADLISYIRKAKKITGLSSLSPEKFKEDLLKTVCILVSDGNRYSYNHRSFQEYFSAIFLTKTKTENKIDLYWRYLDRGPWDNALNMAFEIDRHAVEREFILPVLQLMTKECGKDPIRCMHSWFEALSINSSNRNRRTGGISKQNRRSGHSYSVVGTTKTWEAIKFIERAYSAYSKKGALRGFNRILSHKKFSTHFGNGEVSTSINFNSLKRNDRETLESLGIIEAIKLRITYLNDLRVRLEKSCEQMGVNSVDDWL